VALLSSRQKSTQLPSEGRARCRVRISSSGSGPSSALPLAWVLASTAWGGLASFASRGMADLFDLGDESAEIERVLCLIAETHVRPPTHIPALPFARGSTWCVAEP
jgi:hypothetical protein